MLPTVRLIQVGDIHLPSAVKSQRNIDQKDRRFSVELRNIISSFPIKVVFKKIHEILDSEQIDAILFMGDMTDIGSLENYERAINFVANSLQIGDGRTHSHIPVGIVPGNHDINRDLAKKPGLVTKFQPLNEHLQKHKLPCLPIENTISIPIKKKNAAVDINLMNSCWGCGANEYVPEEFRNEIQTAINNAIETGDEKHIETYYDRQLDTPAFSNKSINDIINRANSIQHDQLLILVAHHNALPQRLTRISPYTELVNSGTLRASITECKRPTIYLHGHIHEDPVEVISNPDGGNMLCISAPIVSEGFNEIEIRFTASGVPLACRISRWRFNPSGILHKHKSISLPLIEGRRRSSNKILTEIYMYLLKNRECYWSELTNYSPPFFNNNNESSIQECIELLLADNTIVVENYDMTPQNWIIRASL